MGFDDGDGGGIFWVVGVAVLVGGGGVIYFLDADGMDIGFAVFSFFVVGEGFIVALLPFDEQHVGGVLEEIEPGLLMVAVEGRAYKFAARVLGVFCFFVAAACPACHG